MVILRKDVVALFVAFFIKFVSAGCRHHTFA